MKPVTDRMYARMDSHMQLEVSILKGARLHHDLGYSIWDRVSPATTKALRALLQPCVDRLDEKGE